MHTCITLYEVNRLLWLYTDARCVRRHQELAHRAVALRDHQYDRALRPGLDAILHTVDSVSGSGARRRDRRVQGRPVLARLVDRPRADDLTRHEGFDCRFVV